MTKRQAKILFLLAAVLYLAGIFFAFQPIGDAYYHVINSKDIEGYLFPKECNNFTWMWPPLFHIVGFLSGALIGNWYLATRLVSFASLLISCFLLRKKGWFFLLLFIAMPGAWLIGTNSYAEGLFLMLLVGSATLEGPPAAAALALASLVKHEALLFLPLFWLFNPSLRLFLISLLGQFAFMAWSALTCNNPLLVYGRTQTLVVNPATIPDNLVHGLLAYPMALGVLLPFALVGIIAGYKFGKDKRFDYLMIGSALLVILYEGMTAMGRGTVQGRYLGLVLPAAAILACGPVERMAKKSWWLLPSLVALLAGQSIYMAAYANWDATTIFKASELVSGTILTSCPETLVFAAGRYERAITPEVLTAKVDLDWLKEEKVDYVVYCELEWVDNSNIAGVFPKLEEGKIFEAKINKDRGKVAVFKVQ